MRMAFNKTERANVKVKTNEKNFNVKFFQFQCLVCVCVCVLLCVDDDFEIECSKNYIKMMMIMVDSIDRYIDGGDSFVRILNSINNDCSFWPSSSTLLFSRK